MKTFFPTTLAVLLGVLHTTDAHGRLIVPPHRGYIGKLPQFSQIPINYDDHGLNGGGLALTSSGKHGVCGDPYDGVRAHETGGKYATFPTYREKSIGACYAPGSVVDLQVQITANHMGYFEFGLCKLNGRNDKETEECFQSLVQPNGQKQWPIPSGAQTFTIKYALPAGVTCEGDSHCVLRWWYVGGNNPGAGINGQEQFWNCADIYIGNSCGGAPSPSSSRPSPSSSTPTPTSVVPSPSSVRPTPSSNKPTPSSSRPRPTLPSTSTASPSHYPTKKPTPSKRPNCTKKPKPSHHRTTPVPSDSSCGGCTNCYYAPTNACFYGWTQQQCASVSVYKWCGASLTTKPSMTPSPVVPTPPSKPPSTPKPSSAAPSPGNDKYVSWNWFATSTTDCDASLSADTLNRGLYVGGDNIPADCGKTATFSYNGKTVTATYAWRTGGGKNYNELSPQAFAKLLGSNADASKFTSASAFQAAIQDPGHVNAKCSGVC